ncbi:MAG: ATP-binding protein [Desulfobulbaceae bacterium]|nr:ATP-binding protein [Desulfobulbaceae bacterium]HIJ78372.1 response regulator [Deltaproteobacteria bacterium]
MAHTVLFVDDNPVILKTIALAFAGEDYNILYAGSGEQALTMISAEAPQVIVSDLRMSGMDGLEFLRRARRINSSFIGMIFTAYLEVDSIMGAVGDDAIWRYIVKPWQDSRELILAVRNAGQFYDALAAQRKARELFDRSERLSALGSLVAGISHQFNNINVGVFGYVQMSLANKALPAEVRDHLENVKLFTKRGSEIVKELAAFSDQSKQWGFTSVCLSETAMDALAVCAKALAADGVEVETRFAETCDAVINYGLVKQMIVNFITNAQHATLGRVPRKIMVETGRRDDHVYVKVIDNGCGIPDGYQKKIFDPFFTTKGAQAAPGSMQGKVSGVGLGLSLSQTVATAHNGEISVKSAIDEGSEFTFLLPAA